jgi:hypothetical protein
MKKTILLIIIITFLFSIRPIIFAQETELPNPGITPDSPFYFLDILGEKISMFFTFGIEKKVEKALKIAKEKLAEIKMMAEKNRPKALEKANQKYQEYLNLANKEAREGIEKGKDEKRLLTLISKETLKHQEECEEYCRNNLGICKEFCEENLEHPICSMSEISGKESQFSCVTEEECDELCKKNPDLEMCKRKEDEFALPELSMPFDYDSVSYADWVIWPFCVHGGDHPEGHGGIDFELKSGSNIYAACDGEVEMIEASEHGNGVMIQCGRIAVGYNGIENLKVKEGDTVKKRDVIGNPTLVGDDYYIHFEVNDYVEKKLKCPLPYFDADFKEKIEKIFSKANYPEKVKEPNLCNCDELPYKESMIEE